MLHFKGLGLSGGTKHIHNLASAGLARQAKMATRLLPHLYDESNPLPG